MADYNVPEPERPTFVGAHVKNAILHVFSHATKYFAIVILTIFLALVIRDLRSDVIRISNITVPASLSDHGYNSEYFSMMLLSRLTEMRNTARTTMPLASLSIGEIDDIEIEIPSTGLSYKNFVAAIKKVFGIRSISINGSVTCGDSECTPENARLDVFVDDRLIPVDFRESDNLDNRLDAVALSISSDIEPYVACLWHFHNRAYADSQSLLIKTIESNEKEPARLFNLLSVIELAKLNTNKPLMIGQTLKATEYINKALAYDENFYPALSTLGTIYFRTGRFDQAKQYYTLALSGDQYNYVNSLNLALLHMAWGLSLSNIENGRSYHFSLSKYFFEKTRKLNRYDIQTRYAYMELLTLIGDYHNALLVAKEP